VIQGRIPGATNGYIRCVYLTNGAALVGFTLTNGAVLDNYYAYSGGGVYCESTNAVLTNCVLSGNSASSGGGACGGTLNKCTLTGNSASTGGGVYGCTLNYCTLTGNLVFGYNGIDGYVGGFGGGADNCTLNNCTLTGNSATDGGGAADSTLNNCALTGNSAQLGGGVFSGRLTNCTLTGNSATGGLWSGGGGASESTLNNCIVYLNTASDGPNYDSGCVLDFCWDSDPRFVDRSHGNLRLQSSSPCINAGNNAYLSGTTDLDGRPRLVGGAVDIGAYEFQGPFNTWLASYGLYTNGPADFIDSDGDSLNNYQEYVADTNPTNAASVLLLTIRSSTSPVVVTFPSSAARLYTLLCCSNLTPTSVWTPVPGQTDIPGNGAVCTLTDTNPPAAAFFRVSVSIP
jgi:hypothetical protein